MISCKFRYKAWNVNFKRYSLYNILVSHLCNIDVKLEQTNLIVTKLIHISMNWTHIQWRSPTSFDWGNIVALYEPTMVVIFLEPSWVHAMQKNYRLELLKVKQNVSFMHCWTSVKCNKCNENWEIYKRIIFWAFKIHHYKNVHKPNKIEMKRITNANYWYLYFDVR
jgi:hypothetical protein